MKRIIRKLNHFNSKVAVSLTTVVGTMWCAYAFAALASISLPDAIKGGVATTISWIAQTFLQLVLLSVIMVGQTVLSVKSEKRAKEDHEMLRAELAEIKELNQLIKDTCKNNMVLPAGIEPTTSSLPRKRSAD